MSLSSARWKDKILDYEIETFRCFTFLYCLSCWSWKDKILDYEIETFMSVTLPSMFTVRWKDKILDYEIETARDTSPAAALRSSVEKIRFSITRLKLKILLRPSYAVRSWKDKILDYEIETIILSFIFHINMSWKDKILDYEIETYISYFGLPDKE